ncbi:MAG: transporter substrate-binding domain-containing protein [Lachnospiraceae bacterium]|nr:transporter substrate-binding domain-containing protein [Lachnospiraceae bacterium]
MKKRIVAALLAAVMGAAALVGCGGSGNTSQNNAAEAEAGAEDAADAEAEAGDAAAEDGAEAEGADANAASNAEAAEGDLLAKIQSAGKIVIAMEGNWAPWTYEDENGNLVGFEVEVSGAVAEKLGVTPEYVTGEWDGLLAGVQAGRYDLMANGVGYTEERAQAYTYSDFYAFNRTALVVRGDNEEIKSMEDLAGTTTCDSANSTYQLLAETYGATVKDVESLAGTIDELMAGRVDATLNAEVSINDYMREQPDADIKIVAFDEDVEQVGMIMPYGDASASLAAAINQALAELREEGKLAEISTKYFGMDITTNE